MHTYLHTQNSLGPSFIFNVLYRAYICPIYLHIAQFSHGKTNALGSPTKNAGMLSGIVLRLRAYRTWILDKPKKKKVHNNYKGMGVSKQEEKILSDGLEGYVWFPSSILKKTPRLGSSH